MTLREDHACRCMALPTSRQGDVRAGTFWVWSNAHVWGTQGASTLYSPTFESKYKIMRALAPRTSERERARVCARACRLTETAELVRRSKSVHVKEHHGIFLAPQTKSNLKHITLIGSPLPSSHPASLISLRSRSIASLKLRMMFCRAAASSCHMPTTLLGPTQPCWACSAPPQKAKGP